MFYKKNKIINKNLDSSSVTYPANHVFWNYSCCGGAVGGGLIGICMGLDIYNLSLILAIFMPIICATIGVFIGFIPAMMTGYILMKLEVIYGSWHVPIVGALVTGISTAVVLIFDMLYIEFFAIDTILILIVFNTVIGALSAIIVGKITLPKH